MGFDKGDAIKSNQTVPGGFKFDIAKDTVGTVRRVHSSGRLDVTMRSRGHDVKLDDIDPKYFDKWR